MNARMPFTRWHRDRGGKLVLRQATYSVAVDRGFAMRSAAEATLLTFAWFVIALVIAVNTLGCGSADGYDSPPESASPELQPTFSAPPKGWCCDAWDDTGKRYLQCGSRVWPDGHPDEVGNRCYCHGVVDGSECQDNSTWTQGTFCTQAELVCWKEEEE